MSATRMVLVGIFYFVAFGMVISRRYDAATFYMSVAIFWLLAPRPPYGARQP